MFHQADNLFFGRMVNGDVRMMKFEQTPCEYPTADMQGPTGALLDIVIPANHWGSIVASVSQDGEGRLRWHDAMRFHNEMASVCPDIHPGIGSMA